MIYTLTDTEYKSAVNFAETVNFICKNPGRWSAMYHHSGTYLADGTPERRSVAGWGQIRSGKPINHKKAMANAMQFFGFPNNRLYYKYLKAETLTIPILVTLAGLRFLGYDHTGCDPYGFNRYGVNRDGCDERTANPMGYFKKGHSRYAYDQDGFNWFGYHPYNYDRDGFSPKGVDKHGNKKILLVKIPTFG